MFKRQAGPHRPATGRRRGAVLALVIGLVAGPLHASPPLKDAAEQPLIAPVPVPLPPRPALPPRNARATPIEKPVARVVVSARRIQE